MSPETIIPFALSSLMFGYSNFTSYYKPRHAPDPMASKQELKIRWQKEIEAKNKIIEQIHNLLEPYTIEMENLEKEFQVKRDKLEKLKVLVRPHRDELERLKKEIASFQQSLENI